jgi:putative membrane protein
VTDPRPLRTANELAAERTDLAGDRTKLAVTRTVIALDRTLMAWIRTATSLISFGFTIYKFFQSAQDSQLVAGAGRWLGPRGTGLVMIGLGVGGLTLALVEYHRQTRDLALKYPGYGPFRRSSSAAVATVLTGLGIVGFVMVLLRK